MNKVRRTVTHGKSIFGAPPPTHTRPVKIESMFLVNKEPSNGTRTTIEILIGAPDSEVYIPVVQLKRNIPDGMSEIKPNRASLDKNRFLIKSEFIYLSVEATYLLMALLSDFLHFKKLSRVILDPAKHDESNRVTLSLDCVENV